MSTINQPSRIYVTGAGFTRAFNPASPLLIDDFYNEELIRKFERQSFAFELLVRERDTHESGFIDIERLMSRLDELMPYDHSGTLVDEYALLLAELKRHLFRRIDEARRFGKTSDEIKLFAQHSVSVGATCITFNYDDLLDESLYLASSEHPHLSWNPTRGYGFVCQSSNRIVSASQMSQLSNSSMSLLKLHGSTNWRAKLGAPKPYSLDSIVHHEDWLHGEDQQALTDHDEAERHLEDLPMIIPPVLAKSNYFTEPILRLVWKSAFELLTKADEVTFIGYSLPDSDVAARTLFTEALSDLPASSIQVVDHSENRDSAAPLISRYRSVCGEIPDENFFLDGAIEWVRQRRFSYS